MNKALPVGIDLGTSTSEICVFRGTDPYVVPDPESKSPIIPSVVAINRRGEIICGEPAAALASEGGLGIREVKRLMGKSNRVELGGRQFRPEEVSALILRRLKDNAEDLLGISVTDVVLSVPAYFEDSAVAATKNAGEIAGLNILRLIKEPTAAALAFGIRNIAREEHVAVFDFGGGTLDVSLLEMVEGVLDVKGCHGDSELGGKDIDEEIIDLILTKFRVQHPAAVITATQRSDLKKTAEEAKKLLSSSRSTEVIRRNFTTEKGSLLNIEVDLTRDELNKAISPLLTRARLCLEMALVKSKLRKEQISRVLMVGGTTYIPAVRDLLAEFFDQEPRRDVNPDLAVAEGAAIQAAIMSGVIRSEESIILTDVAPFGLGVLTISSIGNQLMRTYDSLIAPNQTIPCSVKKTYSLLHENQDAVQVEIYQDQSGTAALIEDANFTEISGEISNIPPALDGRPRSIEVEFSYDINGLVKVEATIPSTKQTVSIVYNTVAARLTEEEKAASQLRLNEIWTSKGSNKRYANLITRALERLKQLDDEKSKEKVRQLVKGLKDAILSEDVGEINTAADVLTDMLFDLDNDQGLKAE